MFNLESAIRDMDGMLTSYDKKLFVRIYGSLISKEFSERLEKKEDSDKLFNELCEELKKQIQLK